VRSSSVAGCALALLAAVSCSVYDSSLLSSGTSDLGSSGQTGTSGATGDGGFAGDPPNTGGAMSVGIGMGGTSGAGGAIETSGTGGMGVGGGSAGGAGTSGAGGSAGSSGTMGGVASSGGGGTTATANGCVKLSVPLDGATDKAHFVISLATPADLSLATISMHLYVLAGSGGSIFNYVQDSGTYRFFGVELAQRAALRSFSGWSTLTWAVGAQPDAAATGIVKTSIENIGIEIGAPPSSSWTSPTVVYIDSITVTTPTLSFTFDGSSSVYPTATTTAATGQALWINGGATDTTAVGVTLGWQATCP